MKITPPRARHWFWCFKGRSNGLDFEFNRRGSAEPRRRDQGAGPLRSCEPGRRLGPVEQTWGGDRAAGLGGGSRREELRPDGRPLGKGSALSHRPTPHSSALCCAPFAIPVSLNLSSSLAPFVSLFATLSPTPFPLPLVLTPIPGSRSRPLASRWAPCTTRSPQSAVSWRASTAS